MGKFEILGKTGVAVAVAMSTVFSVATVAEADTATATANVTVNASSSIGVVPATALGVNTAVWDGHLTDSEVPALLKQINVSMLRYPGGSTSDLYDWSTNKVANGGWSWPQDNFDNFMKVDEAAGAQPIITVNGGTGTAEEAAAWVKYANVTNNYGVKYWEIGNELYGSWEAGNFSGRPIDYAKEVSAYMQAMKTVDPAIQIGVDLIAPGTGDDSWNQNVLNELQVLGTPPDFGIVHWYSLNPGGETDASLLSSTGGIASMMATLKQQLGNIPVFVTETNDVSYNPGRQSTSLIDALFLDDDITTWLQAGAKNVDWWDLHNGMVTASQGANTSPSLYGLYNYGDYGMLSNASTGDGGLSEPAANTPFPTYYGYQMLGAVVQPGGTFVAAGSDNSSIAVHADKLPNGNLAIMFINKDPNSTYNVNLNLQGYLPQSSATKLFYGEGSNAVSQSQTSNTSSVQLPPYSVTDMILQRQNGHQPQGPDVSDNTTVSNGSIKPGETETVSTTFTDTQAELDNATLKVEIDNPAGNMVAQQVVTGVSFKPGETDPNPVTLNFKVPNVQGNYTVKAFALSSDGAATFLADNGAATFTVLPADLPQVSASVALSATTVQVGTPVTITTKYTETSPTGYLSNGLLVQYAFTSGWSWVSQSAPTASLDPGQSVTESWTWTPTSAGTYIFPEGVFTGGWSLLQWINQPNVELTVTN